MDSDTRKLLLSIILMNMSLANIQEHFWPSLMGLLVIRFYFWCESGERR